MTTIGPNTKDSNQIDIGQVKVEISPTAVTNADSLPTDYLNAGLTSDEEPTVLTTSKENIKVYSGFPKRVVKQFFNSADASIACVLKEFDFRTLSWLLGEDYEVSLVSASADTVGGTPTTTSFDVTTIGNFAVGMLIEIDLGTGGTADKHYRVIESISSSTITLKTPLKEAPAASDTVTPVSNMRVPLGKNAAPPEVSVKLTKTHIGTGNDIEIVLYKASAQSEASISFENSDVIGLPVTFTAISDADVEDGALGHVDMAQKTS